MSTPWLFQWRDELLSDGGPPATRRLVLLVLSTYGDDAGARIYPSTRELARATGLSRRRVEGHLRDAEDTGWIRRAPRGGGQGWRRMTYTLSIPGRGDAPSPPSTDGNVGTLRHDVGTLRPQRGDAPSPEYSRNSPGTSVELNSRSVTDEPDGSPVATKINRADTMDALFDALDDARRLANTVATLPGALVVSESEAEWIIAGVRQAIAAGMVMTAMMEPSDLVAEVLYDMSRKGKRWDRQLFRSWLERAITLRWIDPADAEDDCRYVREVAWK